MSKLRSCVICGLEFEAKYPSSPTKLCSLACKYELARRNAILQFSDPDSKIKTAIATKLAMNTEEVKINHEQGIKNRRSYKGENHPLWGTERSIETKEKIGRANKGRFKGMSWEEIMGEARAQKRKIENSNYMIQTNELLLNNRSSKLETIVENLLEDFGYERNKRISKYVVDFVHPESKKILEVNGDYWHCNPELFDSDFFNYSIDMTSQEKWDHDKNRRLDLEKLGYTISVVWENDMKKYGDDIVLDSNILDLLHQEKEIKIELENVGRHNSGGSTWKIASDRAAINNNRKRYLNTKLFKVESNIKSAIEDFRKKQAAKHEQKTENKISK